MKNILFFIMITCCFKMVGQSSINNTTQESDENVNTANNMTKINLYNINLDGEIIPINLVYSHKGVKVNETKNSLGYTWQIQDIGKINQIINDYPDHGSWFTTPNPDFTGYFFYDTCLSSCPSNFNAHTGSDLSPDFFSGRTANGENFEFIYKKNYPNTPIPVLLSNDKGYKINTNFSNFGNNSSGVVFNVIDNKGFNYDFIKGPNLLDINRGGSSSSRNDFYLSTIKNANNTDLLSIEYYTTDKEREEYYRVGYNGLGTGNYDYDNNIARDYAMDYYFIDESRFDLKKITTNNAIIDFVYLQDGHLDEMNITDFHGKYITGYKFEYNIDVTRSDHLWQIRKYSVDKMQSDIIYQFEYSNDITSVESLFEVNDGQFEDYFGYCNGVYKENPFPFQVRMSNGTLKSAGDFTPNLTYAKQLSLKKMINKYGGITEFEYKLNSENHWHFGDTYGGGLLLESVKTIPSAGTGKWTHYVYQELTGYVMLPNSLGHHYIRNYNDKKFYTQILALDFPNYDFGSEPTLSSLHDQGNFYKNVIETTWDLANPIGFQTQVSRDYVPDYTGLYLRPLLKKESFSNVEGYVIKTNDYSYSYETIETVNRATFKTEVRVRQGGTSWFNFKSFRPIHINRVKLISKKETLLNPDSIEEMTSYTYVNANSSIIRSESKTESNGANLETRFFYATDSSLSGEPVISELLSKNIVGVPLLAQSYKGTEKLMEEKKAYAKDATTSNLLLPKYQYFKKGTDSSTNLFKKKMTYDLYDSKGNLLQFSQENGVPISFIWGYNGTYPIAKLESVAYSSISSTIIATIQTQSNQDNDNCSLPSCKQEILRASLNSLRMDFPFAKITTWTLDPLIGKTSQTGVKGDVLFYEYEEYNRIKAIRDRNYNILSENQYHFSTQN